MIPLELHGKSIRLLVFGGRDFKDYRFLGTLLDTLLTTVKGTGGQIIYLVEGEAPGADILAKSWAEWRRIPVLPFKAKWDDLTAPDAVIKINKYGRKYNARAGFDRNQQMIDEGKPTLAVAFPGGNGTNDMVERCKKAGISIIDLRKAFKNVDSERW